MPRHTIEAAEKPILDILCDKYVFTIPSYQRPYAWTTEQTGELLADLLAACPDAGDISDASPYFLGSIVLIKEAQKPQADVVDGQQRLTTLTILLSVLRDLAAGTIAPAIHKYIGQRGDPIEGTADLFRLALRERDVAFFRDTIQTEGSTGKLPEVRLLRDARARIVENAAYLRDRLKDAPDDQRQRLTQYIAKRCFLVVVAASDQESAFRIFSVLNSRGLDLSPADVLKAELIGKLPADQQDAYTEKWEDLEDALGRARFAELVGHIRMIHRKQKMQGTLISEFREFVTTAAKPGTFIDQELAPYAAAFEAITDRSLATFKHSDEINRQLVHLSRLDNVDWQPPAIEAIARQQDDPDFIRQFLLDLERLAYALFLMRTDSTDRIRRYGKVLEIMQAGGDVFDTGSPLQLDATEKTSVRQALEGDIYTITRIRLPLLLRLDEHLSGGSATYNHPVVSVEHVLPQTPAAGSQWHTDFPDQEMRDAWVHKLANLVLLTRRKNAQASNLDFDEKKKRYFATRAGVSNFAMTSMVLSETEWTPAVLEARQGKLIGHMRALWRLD